MYIKSARLSLGFKLVAVIASGYGLYLNSGLPAGAFRPSMLLYFTIQSNVLCLVSFLMGAWRCGHYLAQGAQGECPPANMLWKGAAIMAITTTLLIYWLVLAKVDFQMEAAINPLNNLTVHLFTPVLMLLDWLLFDRKGLLRRRHPLQWALVPVLYYAFTLVASALGARYMDEARYPYFFIDPDVVGWGQVALNVALVAAGFIGLGYLLLGLDALLRRKNVSGNGVGAAVA